MRFRALLVLAVGCSPGDQGDRGGAPGEVTSVPALLTGSPTIVTTGASNDHQTVSYRLAYMGQHRFFRVYLDTDRLPGRGFATGGLHADYLLEGELLHRYVGDGSSWQWQAVNQEVSNVSHDNGAGTASWRVERSAIGETDPCSETTDLLFDVDGWASAAMTDRYVPDSVCGAIHNPSAGNQGETVKYEVGYGGGGFDFLRAYIDADASPISGFAAGAGIGADYLLENGALYKHGGGGWRWDAQGATAVAFTAAEGLARWTLARGALGETRACGESQALLFQGEGRGAVASSRAISFTFPDSPSCAGGQADPGTTCRTCRTWGAPVGQGRLSPVLPELSGLAASRRHPGRLYALNDSGDSARFFLLDELAAVTAELRLDGATAWDWEDMAVGPCPAGWCVFVADTGDGALARDHYTIYRVPEPAGPLPADGKPLSASYERLTFVYPDNGGRYNAEALLVHPQTGRIFVIIKMGGRPSVYELPQPLDTRQRQTMIAAGTLRLPATDSIVTGAAFHPCGDRMLVRTTEALYELSARDASVEALLAATPVRVPVAAEPQGEAVTYAIDGRRYFTASETGAEPPPLNMATCLVPAPDFP